MDVLCSDKTGTLTQNKLTLGDPFTVGGVTADTAILCAALASRAEDQDPIDLAVIGGVKDVEKYRTYQELHFQPFDPVHKRTEATVKAGRRKRAEGRPRARRRWFWPCPITPRRSAPRWRKRSRVCRAGVPLAGRGPGRRKRALAIHRRVAAVRSAAGRLESHDPHRQAMGCRVKMVTGDQMAIAKEVAGQLGLGPNILDASALRRHQPPRGRPTRRRHRAGGRLRPGLSRAQISHRRRAPAAGPHRRHDRRRRERRPGPEEGRRGHRRLRRDRRRPRRRRHRAA